MTFHIHVHRHDELPSSVERKLDLILTLLRELKMVDTATQASLDNLTAKVSEQTTVEEGIETAFAGLEAAIVDLKNQQTDPAVLAAIDQAAAIVAATTDKMKAAIVANTPAAPTSDAPATDASQS